MTTVQFCYHAVPQRRRPCPTSRSSGTPAAPTSRSADQQKREIVAAITDTMVKIGKTTPDQVHVVFQDVEKANWGNNGRLASDTR
ncbi:MAG: tautomerase family protein [Candidatus Rokubacteria bacterium]|nr:tautomerase family protein [Candidatus Rokubacteria bacterium]